MNGVLLRLIVLGEIPGTKLVLSFWVIVLMISVLIALGIVYRFAVGKHLSQMIFPFHRLPRGLSRVDLVSL